MTAKVPALILLCALALCGCEDKLEWLVEQRPETSAERDACAKLEVELMAKFPQSVAGHDQDYDDAIIEARNAAVLTVCRRRRYEAYWTGSRWRYTGKMEELP